MEVPTMAQWVKNSTPVSQITAEAWVLSTVWSSGLKDSVLPAVTQVAAAAPILSLAQELPCVVQPLKQQQQQQFQTNPPKSRKKKKGRNTKSHWRTRWIFGDTEATVCRSETPVIQ